MGWHEPLMQKVEFVALATRGEVPMAALCARFGISRKTGYALLRRFREEGAECFVERSRRPHSSPQTIPEPIAKALLEAKSRHPFYGPRKIRALLCRQNGAKHWPAASTIGELFKRHGLVKPRRSSKRLWTTRPFAEVEKPNDVWAVDFKGEFMLGGKRRSPLTVSDLSSRYLLSCALTKDMSWEAVRAVLVALFREYGMPLRCRSDNGTPFGNGARGLGISQCFVWLVHLGITPELIEPGTPTQNGCHERMHRTLELHTASRQPCRAVEVLETFRREFNDVRPHEALCNETPSDHYVKSPREFPERLPPLHYPCGFELQRVEHDGYISLRKTRLYLSECLAKEIVGLQLVADDLKLLHVGPIPLAFVDVRRERLVRLDQRPAA